MPTKEKKKAEDETELRLMWIRFEVGHSRGTNTSLQWGWLDPPQIEVLDFAIYNAPENMKSYLSVCLCFTVGGFCQGFFSFFLSFLSSSTKGQRIGVVCFNAYEIRLDPCLPCSTLAFSALLAFFQFLCQAVYLHVCLRTSPHALPCARKFQLILPPSPDPL